MAVVGIDLTKQSGPWRCTNEDAKWECFDAQTDRLVLEEHPYKSTCDFKDEATDPQPAFVVLDQVLACVPRPRTDA